MTIMNINGDGVSLWKIPLCIFASAKELPLTDNSTLQVFMVFLIKQIIAEIIEFICRRKIVNCKNVGIVTWKHNIFDSLLELMVGWLGFMALQILLVI